MDMYNRYLMRSSGEKKHQPQSRAEAIVFGIIDFLTTTDNLSPRWQESDEKGKNEFMEELSSQVSRSYANFLFE